MAEKVACANAGCDREALRLFFPPGGGAPPHPEANSRPGLLTNDHEEDSNDHLQKQRDADEGDEGGVVMTGRPLLQHRFQLRGVRHKEGHVQYALCHALLRGIVVQVDGWAPPGAGVPRL